MAAQNDIEMQYQASEQMSQANQASAGSSEQAVRSSPLSPDILVVWLMNNKCSQNKTEEKAKRTFLGMRGGGIILDLCACFICCECMEGCCHAVDDCCCC
ncbi:hypothetical protein DOTSEDRAFT_24468 [Dothistroma septosporum NZE10]|uniref:Uncharacterized protein n=1 Tax=Dothistroma septosporum (strain NZE10 / CBS 128990) TaxID=675120 RepID=N1PPW9_DOTSN|nr:hypothetical protein DOTSEDRAFT_24468 [Dothistroma septosporum NZE10]